MSGDAPVLELSVVKRLSNFTLEVVWTAGSGVAVLFGPSGSGKSITLRCLAGLERPDAGRITVNGSVFFDSSVGIDLRPQRRRIGYVFQGYALFPHLTVDENIGFGLRHLPRAHRVERTAAVIDQLHLGGLERRLPRALSGGQQQRVALGRALAVDPDVLLLDEPLSALDATLRRQLRDDLERTIREWGKPTVLVTHDLSEAYQLADRVIVYDQGRVIQASSKTEFLWQPTSERVASLIGIRNLLHGTVVKATPDRIQLRWRGQLLEAVNSPTRAYLPPPESPVAFFIRPEYVRLIRKDRLAPDERHHMNLMRGRVIGQADLGTAWTLRIRLDSPGRPAQGEYDLEVEVPSLVYEILEIDRDRDWEFSIHRGSIHVLPT
jgi:molybdate transport system ATP-binding protein